MADAHIELDEGLKRSRDIMEAVRKSRDVLNTFRTQLAIMTQMKDGDGAQASHFAKVAAQYGTAGADAAAKNAAAKSLYDELNSMLGNLHASFEQFLSRVG
jgi:hypothetical protein